MWLSLHVTTKRSIQRTSIDINHISKFYLAPTASLFSNLVGEKRVLEFTEVDYTNRYSFKANRG